MARVFNNSEPHVSIEILKKERVCLVRDVDVDSVLPVLEPFLLEIEIDAIKARADRGDKTRELIDCLHRRTEAKSYLEYNSFIMTLAGTQPELFTQLVGRSPTQSEADFCVEGLSRQLKKEITETGHITDSPLDAQQLDLDTQHVQLHIKELNLYFDEGIVEKETEDLLYRYEDHQTEVETKNRNVPLQDVLKAEQGQVKSVLMSGVAGVGKTTSLRWLSRQWALNKWATGFTLLFFLQLDMLSSGDIYMTANELLTLYGLCQLTTGASKEVLGSWLRNAAGRVILLMDGVDGILGFSQKFKDTQKITDLNKKAHPVDLCINILRSNLLPGRAVICTSKPFIGLSNLRTDTTLWIHGLTREHVHKFVRSKHPHTANQILSVLHRNPLLMSVCRIPFYCMAVSTLLSEGVQVMDEDVQTYTRLTAFILVQYVSRKLGNLPFVLEVSPFFPKLAFLAYKGIFMSPDESIPKTMFSEYDLVSVRMSPSELDLIRGTGFLKVKDFRIGSRKSLSAKFLHLSIQEMLAVAHIISNPAASKETMKRMLSGGCFNMAVMYMFGLYFDKGSNWIKDVHGAVNRSEVHAESEIYLFLFYYLKELSISEDTYGTSGERATNKVKVCQLVFESQKKDLAKSVVNYIVPDGELVLSQITVIDLLAVLFVCQHAHMLTSITLRRTYADEAFIKILSSFLIKPCTNICKPFAGAVVKSHCLKMLHVSNNNGALAQTRGPSISLQVLDVSFNAICDDGAEALAEALHTNNSLQVLNVSNNVISVDGAKALAEALHVNKTLKTLHLYDNKIGVEGAVSLSEALVHNYTLQELDVSDNVINVAGAKALAEALHVNKSLKVLLLEATNIDPEGAVSLSEALVHNHTLQELDVSCNHIGVNGARALAEALHTNNSLQVLAVAWNGISEDGAKALAEALHTNNSLQVLGVSENEIGDTGTKALAEGLQTNKCLQKLNISCNELGETGVAAFSKALHTNNSLRELDVSRNHIGDKGARVLAEALHTNSSLQVLDVSENNIGDTGTKALAEGLQTNKCLQKLNISCNELGETGAEAFSKALCTNNSLRELDVSLNHIGNNGARALAEALHTNKCLQKLNISCNELGDTGVEAFIKALCTNNSLRELDVSRNHIGAKGARVLAEALHKNSSLQVLDVSSNKIGDTGTKALAEALHTNKCLQKLYISHNKVGEIGAEALIKALCTNNSLRELDVSENNIGEASITALAKALGFNRNQLGR